MYWNTSSMAMASFSTSSLDEMLDKLPNNTLGLNDEQLDSLLLSQDVLVRLRRGHDRRLAILLGHPTSLQRMLKHCLSTVESVKDGNVFLNMTAIPDRATTLGFISSEVLTGGNVMDAIVALDAAEFKEWLEPLAHPIPKKGKALLYWSRILLALHARLPERMLPWIKDNLRIAEMLLPCHLETLTSLLMDADLGAWMIDDCELARMIVERVAEQPSAMLQLWRCLGNQYDALQFSHLLPELFRLASLAETQTSYPCSFTVYLDMITCLVDERTLHLADGLRSLQSRFEKSASNSLGMERLWMVRLWRHCLLDSLVPLHVEFKIPQLLFDLFKQFPEHTLLHTEFIEYVKCISEHDWKLLDLLIPALPQLILTEHARARSLSEQPRQGRPTWMGHLMQLAQSMPDGCCVGWDAFVRDHLSYYRQQMQIQLGGSKPTIINSAGSDLDEQFLNWGSTWATPQDEQLARYFCQQIIGRMAHLGILDDDEEEEVPSIGIPVSGAGGAFDNLISQGGANVDEADDFVGDEDDPDEEQRHPSPQIRWILNQM